MALRAGYWGIKKLLSPLKLFKPGELGIDQDALIEDLNSTFYTRSEQAVTGSRNLFQNIAGTTENNGVTFTANSDGTVTANGTATGAAALLSINSNMTFFGSGKSFKLSGCPAGGSTGTYCFAVQNAAGQWLEKNYDKGNGVVIDEGIKAVSISIAQNYHADNIVFKPMITLATDPDSDYDHYTPYAMTNKQLTDELASKITFKEGTSLLTPGENITLGTVMKNRVGNLVTYSFVMTTTDAIAANSRLLSGMDAPAPLNDGIYSGTIYGDGTLYKVIFSISSSVPYLITQDAIPSGKSLRGSMTYITKAAAANRSLPDATREASPEEVTPEEAPATRSTKKTTKKTAEADINE